MFYGSCVLLCFCQNGVFVVVKWLLWIVKRILLFMMCKKTFSAATYTTFLAATKYSKCGPLQSPWRSVNIPSPSPFLSLTTRTVPLHFFCSRRATRKACVGVEYVCMLCFNRTQLAQGQGICLEWRRGDDLHWDTDPHDPVLAPWGTPCHQAKVTQRVWSQ